MAHIHPINFGTFDGTIRATSSALNSISGNFGWIDGTNADWSDTHKLSVYQFTLTSTADIQSGCPWRAQRPYSGILAVFGFSVRPGFTGPSGSRLLCRIDTHP
jgi:hypothetical protein